MHCIHRRCISIKNDYTLIQVEHLERINSETKSTLICIKLLSRWVFSSKYSNLSTTQYIEHIKTQIISHYYRLAIF